MSSFLGFIVGVLQSTLSLLGFVQANPQLPQPVQDQAVQVAQQAVTQATQTSFEVPGSVTLAVGQTAIDKLSDGYSARYIMLDSISDKSVNVTLSVGCWKSSPAPVLGECDGLLYDRTLSIGKSADSILKNEYVTLMSIAGNTATIKFTTSSPNNTDLSVATPVSTTEQTATIQAEKNAYGGQDSSSAAPLKTFASSEYGFSIQYPEDLTVDTKKNIFDVAISVPNSVEGPGDVQVTTTGNTEHCEDVPADPYGELGIQDKGTVYIDGVPFKSISHGDVSTGHGHSVTQYTTVYNGACYGIVKTLDAYDVTRLDSSQQLQANTDLGYINTVSDEVVQSFRLLPIQNDPTKVANLKQYEDKDFGFSFWMPQNWVLTATGVNTYKNGATSKRLDIGDVISITELFIPDGGFVTDSGASGTHGPVTYSYDSTLQKWMVHWTNGNPTTGSTATTTADVAYTTVGGLPVFTGSSHYSSMFIPLSPNKILSVSDQGAVDSRYLAVTITRLGQQLAPSAQTAAMATEAQEFFGGKSSYPK